MLTCDSGFRTEEYDVEEQSTQGILAFDDDNFTEETRWLTAPVIFNIQHPPPYSTPPVPVPPPTKRERI